MKWITQILTKGFPYLVLLLLLFIPLYPKLPLLDVQHTWVYIRVEDFLVFFILAIWFFLLFKKEVTLKTPLTIPILAFWIVGAIATIHGVVVIFPTIANVFPNVALLAYLRHIEYLSLFFVAYSAVKSKKFVLAAVWTSIIALVGVIFYGFGQKFLSFPAYLTMNEEYAKGIPIIISPFNRISSTFAGHYDLAAYLVLIIPIVVSLVFGFKNIFIRIFLALVSLLGVVLLFMTVSRVSFFVLFIALFALILFYKKKLAFVIVPLVILAGVAFLSSNSSLLARFGNTVQEVDVLVDAESGQPIGHVRLVPRSYLKDKIIIQEVDEEGPATPSAKKITLDPDIPPALRAYEIPGQLGVIDAVITSTGESLPQGSAYINLPLSPVTGRLPNFFYEYPIKEGTTAATIRIVPGDFLVKKAAAYDLSFTTRFQGEWPNALAAFGRNLFFGSGYGSVSLAVDNNYYRMLGETGFLGTASFIGIFIVLGIFLKRGFKNIDSPFIRALIVGLSAGIIGLALNAILIDVFEASKVAFQLWLLVGIVAGAVSLYETKHFNVYKEIARALTSPVAVIIYLLLLTIVIYSLNLSTYFSGDDFTWFRWAADCKLPGGACESPVSTISNYFINSEGFFYRPGTKTYFLLMYPLFWLNQVVYHGVSILLHFVNVVLLYMLARKIFKNNFLASASAFVFLISSGYLEIVLWVSATGHLFNAMFILLSLLLYVKWYENKKILYLATSLVSAFASLFFYELGIITPFLALIYVVSIEGFSKNTFLKLIKNKVTWLLFAPNIIYFVVRLFAHTHWFQGDYSYNLVKLPFNAVGNLFGYLLISLLGPASYPAYEKIRLSIKSNIPLAIILGVILVVVIYFVARYLIKHLNSYDKRVVIFSCLFFAVCLIPFLGLGNITFRYSYLASFGAIMLAVLLVSKLFVYLKFYGKDIAVASIATIIAVFCLFHIIQAQQTIIEWGGAGEKVQKFLSSIDRVYSITWSDKNADTNIYFTNVIIKNGNAWVFPVGLEDAMWFAFKNENIGIHLLPDMESVPRDAFSSKTKWALEFQPDGSVKRVVWSKKGLIYDEK